jgi:hypothetical protein
MIEGGFYLPSIVDFASPLFSLTPLVPLSNQRDDAAPKDNLIGEGEKFRRVTMIEAGGG